MTELIAAILHAYTSMIVNVTVTMEQKKLVYKQPRIITFGTGYIDGTISIFDWQLLRTGVQLTSVGRRYPPGALPYRVAPVAAVRDYSRRSRSSHCRAR